MSINALSDSAVTMVLVSTPQKDNAVYSFSITPAAVDRICHLTAGAPKQRRFRVRIEGGGCSGFQYRMAVDDGVLTDDWVYEFGGAVVVVDDGSMPFLSGTVLDFESTMMSSLFVLKNPNAKSGCGCGNSFSPL